MSKRARRRGAKDRFKCEDCMGRTQGATTFYSQEDLDKHIARHHRSYCFCRRGENGFMLQCLGCDEWFHGTCVNITEKQSHQMNTFVCPACTHNPVSVDLLSPPTSTTLSLKKANVLPHTRGNLTRPNTRIVAPSCCIGYPTKRSAPTPARARAPDVLSRDQISAFSPSSQTYTDTHHSISFSPTQYDGLAACSKSSVASKGNHIHRPRLHKSAMPSSIMITKPGESAMHDALSPINAAIEEYKGWFLCEFNCGEHMERERYPRAQAHTSPIMYAVGTVKQLLRVFLR